MGADRKETGNAFTERSFLCVRRRRVCLMFAQRLKYTDDVRIYTLESLRFFEKGMAMRLHSLRIPWLALAGISPLFCFAAEKPNPFITQEGKLKEVLVLRDAQEGFAGVSGEIVTKISENHIAGENYGEKSLNALQTFSLPIVLRSYRPESVATPRSTAISFV